MDGLCPPAPPSAIGVPPEGESPTPEPVDPFLPILPNFPSMLFHLFISLDPFRDAEPGVVPPPAPLGVPLGVAPPPPPFGVPSTDCWDWDCCCCPPGDVADEEAEAEEEAKEIEKEEAVDVSPGCCCCCPPLVEAVVEVWAVAVVMCC